MAAAEPGRKSGSRSLGRALRGAQSLVKRVDRADLPLLRWIPSRWKRRCVDAFFRLAARVAARRSGNRLSAPANRHYLEVLAGNHEPEVRALLERELTPGMRVLDIGANIGYFTVHMARLVGPNGRVWALEPVPENLVHLVENVRRHGQGRVRVLALAAGRERRLASLHLREDSRRAGLYADADSILEVPVFPLDDLLAGERLDLVKIDTEGGDLEVLRGMEALLEANPRLRIVAEWHPAHLRDAGHDPDELPAFFSERGFDLFAVDAEGRLHPLDRSTTPAGYMNLYAVRHTVHAPGLADERSP